MKVTPKPLPLPRIPGTGPCCSPVPLPAAPPPLPAPTTLPCCCHRTPSPPLGPFSGCGTLLPPRQSWRVCVYPQSPQPPWAPQARGQGLGCPLLAGLFSLWQDGDPSQLGTRTGHLCWLFPSRTDLGPSQADLGSPGTDLASPRIDLVSPGCGVPLKRLSPVLGDRIPGLADCPQGGL